VINTGRRRRCTEIISMLLEKADVQGYLTTEDLIEVYPDVSSDADRFEAVVMALRRHGVDFLDQDGNPDFGDEEELTGSSDLDPSFASLGSVSSDDTIGLYLREMSCVALLSLVEEQGLAKRIERGRQCRQELEYSNGRTPIRKRRELEAAINDGVLAREHLIKANTRH